MGDTFIDSGTTAALNSGLTAGPIGLTGTWPGSAGTYYLIVAVSAADDVNAVNDEQANGGTAVTTGPAPDYEISATNLPANGSPGVALSAPHNFDIQNTTANPGTQSIDWVVYASLDQVLDGGDTMIASGSTGPLGAAPASTNIDFTGNWPGFGSYYNLIIDISADDDGNPVNDRLVASSIPVPVSYAEIETNDDGPPNPAATDVHNIGVINQNELIEITGTMEGPINRYDTFEFQAGAGVTKIEMTATWATGLDDLDIDFWHNINGGATLGTADTDVDVEPGSPPWTIVNLTPGENYCVGLKQWLNGTGVSIGAPYTLLIRLLP